MPEWRTRIRIPEISREDVYRAMNKYREALQPGPSINLKLPMSIRRL